jgi:hypothetical protein
MFAAVFDVNPWFMGDDKGWVDQKMQLGGRHIRDESQAGPLACGNTTRHAPPNGCIN